MKFEWDPNKARSNYVKHGVSFEDGQLIWKDPLHDILPDQFVDGEQRWHAVGAVGPAVLLAVHVYPVAADEAVIRLIGVRRATRQERKMYEEGA